MTQERFNQIYEELRDSLINVSTWVLSGRDMKPDDWLTFYVGDKLVHSSEMSPCALLTFIGRERLAAKDEKDWDRADEIRQKLLDLDLMVRDERNGTWITHNKYHGYFPGWWIKREARICPKNQ